MLPILIRANSAAYEPHVLQREFHACDARVRGWFTANRVGKTTAGVRECLMWASGSSPFRQVRPVPNRIRVAADGFEYGVNKILLPVFRRAVNPAELEGGSWESGYRKGDHSLRFANGSIIEFMSYRLGDMGRGAQMFAGVDIDLLWFDEHGPEDVWEEGMARIGTRGAVNGIVTLTPVLGKTWEHAAIYQKWIDGDPEYACFGGTIHDNPYLPVEAIESFLKDISDPRMREVRERGVWINVGGMVYPMWQRERHFIRYDAERVRTATKTVVIDPHPSLSKGHWVLWCGVDQDQRMFAYREAQIKKPIPEIADDIRRLSEREDIRRFLIDRHWGWEEVDTGKSVHQQYREAGIPVEPASEDKIGGIQLMQTALQLSPTSQRAMFEVMDTCPVLADQFESYSWKPQTEAMRESDRWKTVDEKDDVVTCARYYVQSNPRFLGRAQERMAVQVPRYHLTSPSMRRGVAG